VDDRGIPFIIHVGVLQEIKQRASGEPKRETPFDPFLPPDPDLMVCDVGPDHLCVLNKFNVLRDHLLIVTRDYEPQDSWLTIGDFAALLGCMHEMDGLGFYNAGTVAGASQAHKHLQLVPLPLGNGPRDTPIDDAVDSSIDSGTLGTIRDLPFNHAVIGLDEERFRALRADELHRLYRHACSSVGIRDEAQPYNLLLTRRWLFVVPRSREHWRRVSINALGFAGSLLVRNRSELDELIEVGPLAALKSVVTQKETR
jgi:ATP adenylyltransferase